MKPVLGNIYRLSGSFFSQEILRRNNNLFRLEKISLNGTFQFKGMTTHDRQVATVSAREGGSAIIMPVETTKSKHKKRTKGSRHTVPSVDKMKILYQNGSTFTLKNVVSVELDDDLIEFTLNLDVKGDVVRAETVTIPAHDVVSLFVRPAKSKPFLVDFSGEDMVVTTTDGRFVSNDFELYY